jgi:biotin transport system substrate-specific component
MNTFTESLTTRTFHGVAEDQRARFALGVVAFAVAAAFSAQVAVRLPWTPVPVTLQPLMVILAGVVLGPRLGALSMAAYVTVGALGAPVFSNGGAGLPWLLGPTGGYLLAAPAGAWVAGIVSGRGEHALRLIIGLTLGVVTMYVGGVAQLMAATGQGLPATMAAGVVPFLVGDVTKIALAFFAIFAVQTASKKRS